MARFAAVAIGYNRDKSMERLLWSLEKAYYDEEVDLIISIDNSGEDAVEKCANHFAWSHGKKIVKTYPERQGLRKHIIQCGNFVSDYEAIAVLEDDVVVAPGYFLYMKQAVETYCDNDKIAGVSLYNHLWNVGANMPFQPSYAPFDAYFFQFAQSWGQVWMKKQWKEFRDWYECNAEEFLGTDEIPANVASWPKTSWLKYHIKYCIEKDKYFVYPYQALSTCFTDVGEHNARHMTVFQVPMQYGIKKDYHFPAIDDDSAVVYDAFFERRYLDGRFQDGMKKQEVCMNLYGQKKTSFGKKYVASIQELPYKKVASYGLELRPHEENIEYAIKGEEIGIYEVNGEALNFSYKEDLNEFYYRYRLLGKGRFMAAAMSDKIKRKILRKK